MDKHLDLSRGKHRYKHNDLYAVPRRFDLASMLVVTAAFALLFTCMTVLDFDFWGFVYFAALVSTVGLAQSLFASSFDPRQVSLIAGVVYQLLVTLLLFLFVLFPPRFVDGSIRYLQSLLCSSFVIVFVSPVLGYLSGALVAGTFLVADYLRDFLGVIHLHRQPNDDQQKISSPWDE